MIYLWDGLSGLLVNFISDKWKDLKLRFLNEI